MVSQSERGSPVIHIFKLRSNGNLVLIHSIQVSGKENTGDVRFGRQGVKELNWRPDASSLVIRSENVSKKSPNSSRHILRKAITPRFEFETTDCHVLPSRFVFNPLEFHHQQKIWPQYRTRLSLHKLSPMY